MPDRAVFVGFGQPVRGREERAAEVFNEFVGLCGRMAGDGRIEDMDVTLLDFHGGDLRGYFMLHGSEEQCSAVMLDEEFRRACVDASLIVDDFGVVGASTGQRVAEQMTMFRDALEKVGVGGHALAGT